MKLSITLFTVLSLFLFTCKSTKKNKSTSEPTAAAANSAGSQGGAGISMIKSADGIYAPGEVELNTYKEYNKGITAEKLSQGYTLYAFSACVQCHSAKNIYDIKATDWKGILEDMAQKAKITNEQKEAVYDYVLAVKTVKLKQGN